MAKRRVLSTAAKIFGLLILVIALFVGGVLWFDYIDLINANEILDPVLGPVLELVGLRQKEEVIEAACLDELRLGDVAARRETEYALATGGNIVEIGLDLPVLHPRAYIGVHGRVTDHQKDGKLSKFCLGLAGSCVGSKERVGDLSPWRCRCIC